MKHWCIFALCALILILFFLVIGLATSCAPTVQITDVKVLDEGECICLSWTTNVEAVCKVTYCDGGMCYTSSLEPEYGTLHCYGLPLVYDSVTITAIDKSGNGASIEIK